MFLELSYVCVGKVPLECVSGVPLAASRDNLRTAVHSPRAPVRRGRAHLNLQSWDCQFHQWVVVFSGKIVSFGIVDSKSQSWSCLLTSLPNPCTAAHFRREASLVNV